MRGRKPKPTEQRALEGNPGKRPLNVDEPAHDVPSHAFDEPPADLAGAAAQEWRRLAPQLRRARQVTEADRGALIAACLEWAIYLDASRRVAELGLVVKAPSGYPMTNPYRAIANGALGHLVKLWAELGLTPSSRSRVKTVTGPGADDPFSEFDQDMPLAPADQETTH